MCRKSRKKPAALIQLAGPHLPRPRGNGRSIVEFKRPMNVIALAIWENEGGAI